MNKLARTMAFAALLAAAVVGMRLPSAGAQETTDVESHPWIDKAAPEFVLKKVGGGGEVKLKDLKGKYVVIHFGASW